MELHGVESGEEVEGIGKIADPAGGARTRLPQGDGHETKLVAAEGAHVAGGHCAGAFPRLHAKALAGAPQLGERILPPAGYQTWACARHHGCDRRQHRAREGLAFDAEDLEGQVGFRHGGLHAVGQLDHRSRGEHHVRSGLAPQRETSAKGQQLELPFAEADHRVRLADPAIIERQRGGR